MVTYAVEQLTEGGFVVTEMGANGSANRVFATTSLDDALAFIKAKFTASGQ